MAARPLDISHGPLAKTLFLGTFKEKSVDDEVDRERTGCQTGRLVVTCRPAQHQPCQSGVRGLALPPAQERSERVSFLTRYVCLFLPTSTPAWEAGCQLISALAID